MHAAFFSVGTNMWKNNTSALNFHAEKYTHSTHQSSSSKVFNTVFSLPLQKKEAAPTPLRLLANVLSQWKIQQRLFEKKTWLQKNHLTKGSNIIQHVLADSSLVLQAD